MVMMMRPIDILFNKGEYDFIINEEGLTKVGADMRLTEGDNVDITFNLYRIDQDVPHTPESIDLTNKTITFEALQKGPTPETKHLLTPKSITVIGVNQIPLADGVVVMEFSPLDLNTPGHYECVLYIEDVVLGTKETSRYRFPLDIIGAL